VILQLKLFSNRYPGHFCRRYLLIPILSALLLAGCDNSSKQEAAAPAAKVTVIKAEAQDTPIVVEFVGKTASSRRVEIRSRVEGFLEKRLYTEGSVIQAGDVLFEMDKKPFEAQLDAAKAELSQQQARMKTAKANLDRVEPLAKQNAVAKKELDDALGSFQTASAAVEAAKAKVVQAELDLGYCTITSPVTGVSSYATQREGAYIGFGAGPLTYVAQIDPIWIEFSVSENQILQSRRQFNEQRIVEPEGGSFEVEVVLADGTIFPHTGEITFADASLSEKTGTFLIRAEVENPGAEKDVDNSVSRKMTAEMRPGQFVRARLKGAIRPKAILVPQTAVQQGAKGSFVWVIKDGKAENRPVEVGPWHEDDWFIDSGLTAGDVVVVGGALKLRAGTPVEIVEPEAKKTEAAEPATERKD
jgi:membrane fusion protein (multidrug efflux system)